MVKEHSLNVRGVLVTPQYAYYGNGRIAIQYIDGGGAPFAILTVNLPDTELEDGELLIKTWSENQTISEAAIKSGHFQDTGKRVKAGFCEAQIWKLTGDSPKKDT